MSETPSKSLPVALVYGESESSQVLRNALSEIGANLVCDADIASFSVDDLGSSGANVVLISLDAVIEDRLDEVYGALDEQRYRVMFDDPEISNNLDGWEHARWQRHLAAKLHDISDWDPPRPKDAAAVEVPDRNTDASTGGTSDQAEDESTPAWMDEALSVLNGNADDGADSDAGEAQPEQITAVDVAPPVGDDGAVEQEAPEAAPTEASNAIAEGEVTRQTLADETADDSPLEDSQAAPVQPEDHAHASDAAAPGEDADLQAELDALAEADDPLAALSALAGEQDEPPAHDEAPGNIDSAAPEEAAKADAGDLAQTAPAEDEVSADLDLDFDLDVGDMNDAERGDAGGAAKTDAASDDDTEQWDALEAELSAAFDSETLGAIDQASQRSDEPVAQAPAWELAADNADASDSSDAPDETPAANPQYDEQRDAVSTAAKPPVSRSEESGTDAAPSADIAGEAAARASSLPDVSQWALVDDDEPMAAADEPTSPDESEAAAEQQAAAEAAATADEDDDDGNFGLELVDPIDYLKPDTSNVREDVSNELFSMPTLQPMAEAVAPKVGDEDEGAEPDASARIEHVVVLGASIGGPDAVREFLSHLPHRLPASIVLVQHLGSEFVDLMVSQLSKSSALPVRIPGRAERAVHGEVLVVPSGSQLSMTPQGQIKVTELDGDAANNPSINLTMSMAAEAFGSAATAIIFSGMASDAVAGALEVAAHGGQVWVQDPESCVVSKMVDDVIEAGAARFTGTPEALAHKLVALLQETDDE